MRHEYLLFTIAILLSLFRSSILIAQPTYDLRIVEVKNDKVVSGNLDVKIQIQSVGGTFAMGSSNLVFTYNTSGLSTPTLLAVHNFSGGSYNAMTVTQPATNRVSANIELFAPNTGTTIASTFMDVVTIRFTITNTSQTSNIVWRTIAPNPTVVFLDNETALANAGNLESLDVSLPVEHTPIVLPKKFDLEQNSPNPFNPETEIRFQLPITNHILLRIFDTLGREIRTLVDMQYEPGFHRIRWDGKDDKGNFVNSGVYIYQIQSGIFSKTKKMILLR
jgi:hypothetical protein